MGTLALLLALAACSKTNSGERGEPPVPSTSNRPAATSPTDTDAPVAPTLPDPSVPSAPAPPSLDEAGITTTSTGFWGLNMTLTIDDSPLDYYVEVTLDRTTSTTVTTASDSGNSDDYAVAMTVTDRSTVVGLSDPLGDGGPSVVYPALPASDLNPLYPTGDDCYPYTDDADPDLQGWYCYFGDTFTSFDVDRQAVLDFGTELATVSPIAVELRFIGGDVILHADGTVETTDTDPESDFMISAEAVTATPIETTTSGELSATFDENAVCPDGDTVGALLPDVGLESDWVSSTDYPCQYQFSVPVSTQTAFVQIDLTDPITDEEGTLSGFGTCILTTAIHKVTVILTDLEADSCEIAATINALL